MTGALDPYEFLLAERLGMTRQAVLETMPADEYPMWRAFDVYRAEMGKLRDG